MNPMGEKPPFFLREWVSPLKGVWKSSEGHYTIRKIDSYPYHDCYHRDEPITSWGRTLDQAKEACQYHNENEWRNWIYWESHGKPKFSGTEQLSILAFIAFCIWGMIVVYGT